MARAEPARGARVDAGGREVSNVAIEIPSVGAPRAIKAPKVATAKIAGMNALVVRKPTVPRVELRMYLPSGGKINRAAARVLSSTITSGTTRRSAMAISQELQRLGGSLAAGLGADYLQVGGSVLTQNFDAYADLLADVLTSADFPQVEIELERDRLVQQIAVARSQPEVIAQEALMRRLFGKHTYGDGLPDPAAVAKTGRAAVAKLYSETVLPRDGLLVIVGDVQPQRAIDVLGNALKRWKGKRSDDGRAAPPAIVPGRTLVVDRPGSVQTNIRIAGPIPAPDAPDATALEVANTIFGGYFISRFVENLRERNGYTYSPRSGLSHLKQASFLLVAAEVGSEVTGPSLVESRYELGRMVATDVTDDELESAKRYLQGIFAIRIQSQAGLASTLANLVVHGLGIDHLRDYPKKLQAVTKADIREASRNYLAPSKLVTVLVGDATAISADLAALEPFDVTSP